MSDFVLDNLINGVELDKIAAAETIFKNTGAAYATMAKKIAAGIKLNPQDLSAMAEKQKEYTEQLKQLYETQNKLSEQQKECNRARKEAADQIKKNADAIRAEAEANRLNKAAELDSAKAKTEQLKQEKLLNQERKVKKVSVEEAIAIMKQEVKTEREATEQNRLLRIAKKDVDITTEAGRKIVMQMNNVIDRNTALIRKNADGLVKQKMTVGDYKNQVKQALNEMIRGENVAKNLGVALKSGAAAGFAEVGIGIGSMIKGMIGAQAIIGLFQKAIGFIKSGVGSIIDFEEANSKLSAVLGATSANMKELITDAKRLGAETRYTASEVTNLQIELAKLGFSKKEILESTESILKFAQATGADLSEAAALAGASIRMFGASTKETERYVSAMAVATVKSALSFSYLQTAMPIVGPVAKSFNFQIEDTLALLGKLSDAGFDASMAATATRNILLNLADGSGKLAKALGEPVKTLPELVDGLNKLKAQGIDLNKTLELTDKRSVAAFNAFLTAADGIVPLRDQITGVTGELGEMADKMENNVAGSMRSVSSAWEAVMISFSNGTGPAKKFLDWLAGKLRAVAESLKDYHQLIDGAEAKANSLAGGHSDEVEIDLMIAYNKKRKALIDAGHSDEEADLTAMAYISLKKVEIKEEELKKLEELKKKAIEAAKVADNDNSGSFKYLSITNYKWAKDAEKKEKEAQDARNEYMKAQYEMSKKQVANDTIDTFVDSKKKPGDQKTPPRELTDKEKAAQEKAARELLKIRETYQQSELDLMDEGLEKELAKISLNYTKKMATVKGSSAEEIKTRENLAKEMQSAINDKATSYVIAKEQKDIANKLEAVKKGSEEELNLRIEQLELQRDIEITEAIKTGEDISLIDEKYNAKRIELAEKFANEQNKKLQEGYVVRSIMSNQEMENELSALAGEYTRGIIAKEKYEDEKLKIQQKYAIKQAELAVSVAKLQLGTGGLSEEGEMSIKNKIAEAEMALAKLVADANISELEREDEARKKKLKNWEDGLAMLGDALNAFADLGSAIYERKIEEVEGEQDANQEAGDAEIERITRLEETGAITKEEAEARKRAAEQKTAEKDKELAKKKADLQTKQAKMDKANAIAQCIIQTSLAVMSALTTQPFPLGLALAVVAGATGTVQLATIIAQPIPKYAKGTDNHPGGLAVVGDGGREEMIISGGKSWITPSVPTLVDIPKGAVVLPDVMNMESIRGMKSDVALLLNDAARKGEPVMVNVNNDYRKLEGGIDRLNSSFDKMAKFQRKAAVQADLRNIANRL